MEDAGPPDWPSTFELRTVDPRPCDAWAAAPSRSRELPSDPTPRVLWAFVLDEDPIYLASGIANHVVGAPTIGADGNLLLVGPDAWRVMSIGRDDGRIRWLTDPLLDVGASIPHPIVAAPDGTAFVIAQAPEAFAQTVYRLDASGAVIGEYALPGPDMSGVLGAVTIASDGRILVTTRDGRLQAMCPDFRLAWELIFRDSARRPATVGAPLARADGSILLGIGGRVVQFDASGGVVGQAPGGTYVPGTGWSVVGAGADDALLRVTESVSEGRVTARAALWGTAGLRDAVPARATPIEFALDPVGGVWVQDNVDGRPPASQSRWVGGTPQWTVDATLERFPAFGEDGSLVGILVEIADSNTFLIRMLPDGSIPWRVAPAPRGDRLQFLPSPVALDVDGSAFLLAQPNVDLVRIQTDVLPPGGPGCWDYLCGAARDGWGD